MDEINAHFRIFIADAAHFLMLFMRCFHIIHRQCQMEFVFSQIVGFFPVSQPGQLQGMRRFSVAHVGQNKGAVRCLVGLHSLKSQCFLIKGNALFQVQHIEIIMIKCKFHNFLLFLSMNDVNSVYHKS